MSTVTTTYLQMTDPGQLRPKHCDDPRFQILEVTVAQWRYNRFLYELVGKDWLWEDKLALDDAEWKSYVEDENLRTFVAYYDGAIAGYFELFRRGQEVEIIYFGLTPEFIGRGLGGALLTRTIEEAWTGDATRVWVHTCTLDHEAALQNYKARGMVPYKTEAT